MNTRFIVAFTFCLLVTTVIASAAWLPPDSAPKRLVAATLRRVEEGVLRAPLSKAAGGVYDTTDRYLDELQVPSPSEKALNVFAGVPAEDAMVFITSGTDPQSELVYRSISYLGWPRQIGKVQCNPDGSAEFLFRPQPERPVRWLFFHRLAPPADLTPESKTIGRGLALAHVSELKKWKSYCSR